MKLKGKKALITGGNSGIGLATARLFVAEGAEVAITGRDQQTLDEAVAELGSKARGYRADVTVAEDRKELFAELSKDFGKLDILFANAGISGRTPTGTTDEAIFEKVVHTNLNGAFFTVNSATPLLNDNASIIFNGSVHNYLGQAGLAAYAATKGGVVSMARAIAADFAPRNRSPVEGSDGTPRQGSGHGGRGLQKANSVEPFQTDLVLAYFPGAGRQRSVSGCRETGAGHDREGQDICADLRSAVFELHEAEQAQRWGGVTEAEDSE